MTVEIPYDDQAEREVVGCAVADAVGYRIAAAAVTAEAFYVPRYGRLFAACASLDDIPRDYDSAGRVRSAARLAEVDTIEVRRLVDERSLFHDIHGHFARRVAEMARRRHAMAALAEAFNLIGEGASPEDALRILERVAA